MDGLSFRTGYDRRTARDQVRAASDALFREEATEETTERQQRADALGLLAERALAAGFRGAGGGFR